MSRGILQVPGLLLALTACAGTQTAGTKDAGREQAAASAMESGQHTLAGMDLRCAATDDRTMLGSTGAVQVIELWATWCTPCVKALPLWAALAKRDALEILAVSIDDSREAATLFAKKHGIDLPLLWDPFANSIAAAVPLQGVVPTTLVLDCEGRVRHVHNGFAGVHMIDVVAAEAKALGSEASCKQAAPGPRCEP